MRKRILVTDTVFIKDEHVKQLEQQGYAVERLAKSKASEDELREWIKGKHGYILGGIERVTEPVVAAADQLQAIAFTGSGYTEYIPAYEAATRKGIAISAAIGLNAQSVAEYTLLLILTMVRNLPLLTTPPSPDSKNKNDFYTATELGALTLGVIGFGHVGSRVSKLAQMLGMRVLVTSRHRPQYLPSGIEYVSLDTLLAGSDVVTIHVDKQHGTGIIGKSELQLMKAGAILINTALPEAIDNKALHVQLTQGLLRAAFDAPPEGDFSDVPIGGFIASNAQTAFNTHQANKRVSDRVTTSLINLLSDGDDPDLVNPEFKHYRV
jgi:D-3-phosphoglycerate dehydrogenase